MDEAAERGTGQLVTEGGGSEIVRAGGINSGIEEDPGTGGELTGEGGGEFQRGTGLDVMVGDTKVAAESS